MSEREPTFQEGLNDLERIVAKLESGELSLEEALHAFERGVGLVRLLHDKLNEAEKRIETLSRDPDGRLQLRAAKDEAGR
jgi:exodeoxyribonuclease VII small subunit